MTLLTLSWRNLWRNRTRTILTIASLAFSVFLFTLLSATVASMNAVAAESAGHLRLVVHRKTSVTELLPLSHAMRIGSLPGVRTVCGMRWFGGRVPTSQEQFPSMAVDVASFPVAFDDFGLTADEWSAWASDRTAAVVGRGLAGRMGWKAGDRVSLKGSVPPYLSLDYRIAGVTSAPAYPNVFVFRFDYLHEALAADPMMPAEHDDTVNIYWVKADSAAALDPLRRAIDATCATTGYATLTELEESFVTQFTKMFGDIPGILRKVGLLVVASILIVVCNTVLVSVRERVRELAVLKAIGFSSARLFRAVLSESLLIGLMGGLLGALPALGVFGLFGEAGLSIPYFPIITVSPAVALAGVAAGVLIGLASALPPARRVQRVAVVNALRDLE